MSDETARDGVHRLIDMVVEEVSLVDRAANNHRFLVVKRSDTMSDAETPNPPEPEAPTTEETPPEVTKADPDVISIASSALENLSAAIDQLGGAATDEETTAIVSELAALLNATAEELAEAVGLSPADAPDTMAMKEAAAPFAETRALLERVSQMIAGARAVKATSEAPVEKASAPPEPTLKVLEPLRSELAAIGTAFKSLADALKAQGERIGRLEKNVGLPNSGRAAESPATPEEEAVGWPLDLNKPLDRTSVDKAVSFHDP